jgi:hypothetical protein
VRVGGSLHCAARETARVMWVGESVNADGDGDGAARCIARRCLCIGAGPETPNLRLNHVAARRCLQCGSCNSSATAAWRSGPQHAAQTRRYSCQNEQPTNRQTRTSKTAACLLPSPKLVPAACAAVLVPALGIGAMMKPAAIHH